MKMIDTTHRLFDPDAAEAAAAELNSADEDWDYRVVHDPTGAGWSFIEIFDEEGEFVARLT